MKFRTPLLSWLVPWLVLGQGGDLPVLRVGEPVEGVIEDGDSEVRTDTLDASYSATPTVGRRYRIEVPESGPYHVELRSWSFNAYLVVRDADGNVLAENDDGLFATHALLALEFAGGTSYVLEACALHGDRGPFELVLASGLPRELTAADRAAAGMADAERRVQVAREAEGPESEAVAHELNELGVELYRQGRYAEAGEVVERSLAIREKVLGPEHPDTAQSLNNLAAMLQAQGNSPAARPLYERALAINEKVLGPEHPETVTSLSNLALLLHSQGEYWAARSLYERSLAIREKVLGPEHPDTAASLNNLAGLLETQRDTSAARPLYERSLAIREKVLGPEHPATGQSLNNLAGLLEAQGDYSVARPLFERSLAITQRVLGPEHPDTAQSLSNLAGLLHSQGDYSAARPLLERSLAIKEKVLGPEHPETATGLNNLAVVLRAQGDCSAARPLYERALAITEKVLGPEHPGTARSLNNLAILLADTGELERARRMLSRSAHRRRAHVQRVLGGLTEAESFQYLAQLHGQLEVVLSLCVSEDPAVLVQGYEGLLAWKGRIARSVIASREQLARDLSEEQRSLVERLRAQQARLSRLLSDEAGPEQAEHLAALSRERNALELELTRTLDAASEPEVSFDDLRAALPADAAVLDLFVHGIYTPARWEDEQLVEHGTWRENHVVAWITRPEGEGSPLARVDLGPATALGTAVRGHLERVVAGGRQVLAQRGVSLAGTERAARGAAEELRRLLWDPLAPHLEGVDTLFVSPDGALGTLPFETIEREDGTFLVEHLAFVYLADVTSIAREEAGPEPAAGSLLAVGAVDFENRGEDGDLALAAVAGGGRTSSLRGGFGMTWRGLPATGPEARAVADLHAGSGAEELLLFGPAATEERLKRELSRHAVLHLATHGFFQPEGTASMWESALDEQGRRETRMSEEAAQLVGKHPGLLSGLVCAGANREAEEGRDDGYLTAEEVGWLDLSGVELVVLSACETGLGRAQSGEGLIGLRRAFEMAGAQTVVSSLWSVKDESTAELMRDFYKNLWLVGMGRHEALRAAQLAMLASNRMEHGDALPSTWGAFVLSGEWR